MDNVCHERLTFIRSLRKLDDDGITDKRAYIHVALIYERTHTISSGYPVIAQRSRFTVYLAVLVDIGGCWIYFLYTHRL